MEAIRSRPLWNDHYDNHVTGLRLSGTAAREPLEQWTRSVTPVASGPQPGYHGVPVEEIARLAGHASLRMTEVIYRRELRPVITTGTEVMDQIFRSQQVRRAGAAAVR